MKSRSIRTVNLAAFSDKQRRKQKGHCKRQFRSSGGLLRPPFDAGERYYPHSRRPDRPRIIVRSPGKGHIHPCSPEEVRARLAQVPAHFLRQLEVVQLSTMTRKRRYFNAYGMQWGESIYLYPVEESLVEIHSFPPLPQQQIEAKMFGARWVEVGAEHHLVWTPEAIKDFYLNFVLIHEIGHLIDRRDRRDDDSERFADWFAIEYGYRRSRG